MVHKSPWAQSGSYPFGDVVSLTVTTSRSEEFELRLRIPAWAQQPSIRINGKHTTVPVKPGTFASLKQKWRSGDRIDLELPRRLELKAVDSQHPDTIAVVFGPLVLFAVAADTPQVKRAQLLAAKRQTPESPEWHDDIPDGRLRLMPFWVIKDERYSTYLCVS
jgi:DUF1680 family protein